MLGVRYLLLLWAFVLPLSAGAQICSSITPSLTPAPASLYAPQGTTQVAWSGTLTITFTNCVKGGGLFGIDSVPFSTTYQQMGAVGVARIRTTGITTSNASACTGWTITAGEATTYTYRVNAYWPANPASTCTYIVTIPLEIQVSATGSGGVYKSSDAPVTSSGGWYQSSASVSGVSFVYKPNLQIDFRTLSCTLTSSNITVALDPIPRSTLAAQPNGPIKSFNIAIGGCGYQATPYPLALTFEFTAGPQTNLIANTAPSGAAANVYVQLLDTTQTPITNNATVSYGTLPANRDPAFPLNATFYARYVSPGSPGAGQVQGVARLTIAYP